MLAFAGEAHAGHDPPYGFSRGALGPVLEVPARVAELRAALSDLGVTPLPPTPHDDARVLAAHAPELVDHLRGGWSLARASGAPEVVIPDVFPHARLVPSRRARTTIAPPAQPGAMCFDCSSPLVAGTWLATREAADVALAAADAVAGGERVAYALCRPPGHHSGRDYYGGFCYLNNAAIAARRLAEGGRRVAVLDIDVHHGNGTQAIFWTDPAVLAVSLHQHPDYGYPYFTGHADERGGGDARGTNLNITLPRGCDDAAYRPRLLRALRRIAAFSPDFLVVAVGFDAHLSDPLSETRLSAEGFGGAAGEIAALRLPTVAVQEGGYALGALRACLRAFLQGISRE